MKIKLHALFIILAAFISFSCVQPTNNTANNSTEGGLTEETVSLGWYLYITNANSDYPQQTYLYINNSGAIERAGSSTYEYTGSQLEMIQQQLSYSVCKKNADGTAISFYASDAPSWAEIGSEENNDSQYLMQIYTFLSEFGTGIYYDTFEKQTDKISFFNFDRIIRTDENNHNYITCTMSYINAVSENLEYLKTTNLFSDCTKGTVQNARIYYYPINESFLININGTGYLYEANSNFLKNCQANIELSVDFSMTSEISITYWRSDNHGSRTDYKKEQSSAQPPSGGIPSGSDTAKSLIIGTWFCKDAGLFKYLEFYSNGTGKAYPEVPDNHSSFNWSINGNQITLTGNFSNTSSQYSSKKFTVSDNTLWFEKLSGLSDLIFTRQ